MKVVVSSIICATLALLGGKSAAEVIYLCEINVIEKNAKFPTTISFQLSDSQREALVIEQPSGHQIPAVVERQSDHSYSFNWTSGIVRPDGEVSQETHFKALLNVDNLKMSVRSLEQKEDSLPIRGAGACNKKDVLKSVTATN